MGATSQHFSFNELVCHCGCGVNLATQRLVDFLEWLRASFEARYGAGDVRVVVNDATRCATHNASLPNAAKMSQHQYGNAADIEVRVKNLVGQWKDLTAAEVESVARQSPLLGGIGRSLDSTMVHTDVRQHSLSGYVAEWCYRGGMEVDYVAPAAPAAPTGPPRIPGTSDV